MPALLAELRDNPTDARRRTFLFELLCFAGEYERADKQLEVLAQAGPGDAFELPRAGGEPALQDR